MTDLTYQFISECVPCRWPLLAGIYIQQRYQIVFKDLISNYDTVQRFQNPVTLSITELYYSFVEINMEEIKFLLVIID